MTDATTPEQPRTAAGRALLDYLEHDYFDKIVAKPIVDRILAIEAEKDAEYEGVVDRYRAQRDEAQARACNSWIKQARTALASDTGSVGALPLASAEVNGLDVERLARALDVLSDDGLEYDLMAPEEREDRDDAAERLAAAYDAAGEGATFDEAGSVGGVSADTVLVGAEGPALASGTRALRLAAPFVTLVVARWDEGTGLWASTPLHAEGLKAERIIAAAYADAERQGES